MSLQDPTATEAVVAAAVGAVGATVAQSTQPIPTLASQGAALTVGEAAFAYGVLGLLFPSLPGGKIVGALGAGALAAVAVGYQIPAADLPAALGGTLGGSALPATPAGGTTPSLQQTAPAGGTTQQTAPAATQQ